VEIFKKDGTKETWLYTYDALGRRISKGRLKEDGGVETLSDGLEDKREFVWDGSHLLQEVYANGRYTYIYTDVDSYEPLAQIHNYTNAENETYQEINYFHCDQIGIPREMTDSEGKLLWFGDYYGWGKLKSKTNVTETAYQPFRLQNQYFDQETGLHYNFFRYYEPDAGRFVNQDPIGLWGGENFYYFSFNSQLWMDPLGLQPRNINGQFASAGGIGKTISRQKQNRHVYGTQERKNIKGNQGGAFKDRCDAQEVLDAFHRGDAKIVKRNKQGQPIVEYPGVTGYNNNPGAGFVNQETNRFLIKGTSSPSVVPVSPGA
ncbi:RHS repeat-associated core domain-containing protein, partial [Neisseria dentiae]|uniref:RHS repeat-associated core domain-containing protein n=1 Tax=Neisseria dentiae TaxID=194197 RepID=UPI0035A04CA6